MVDIPKLLMNERIRSYVIHRENYSRIVFWHKEMSTTGKLCLENKQCQNKCSIDSDSEI